VSLDLSARLLSQPVLEAARRGGLRPRSSPHNDFAIDKGDKVPSRSRLRRLDAHPRRFSTKENLANSALGGPPHAAEWLYTLQLIEKPSLITAQKGGYVLTIPRDRLHYLDASWPHTKPQFPCGPRTHHSVVDATATKSDLMLGRCFHGVSPLHLTWRVHSPLA
jgi:hypothetical protein